MQAAVAGAVEDALSPIRHFGVVARGLEPALSPIRQFGAVARGPVVAVLPIRHFGTDGGGFFGANSAHPFENPAGWTIVVECVSILSTGGGSWTPPPCGG